MYVRVCFNDCSQFDCLKLIVSVFCRGKVDAIIASKQTGAPRVRVIPSLLHLAPSPLICSPRAQEVEQTVMTRSSPGGHDGEERRVASLL